MENKNSSILPYVLVALSHKPELCDTFDNLCKEIREYFAQENRDARMADIRKALNAALNIGHNLGILSVAHDIVRVPFKFRTEKQQSHAPFRVMKNTDEDEVVVRSKTGRKSVHPRKHNLLTHNEMEFYMVSPRRRIPSSVVGKALTDRTKRRNSKVHRQRSVGVRARGRGRSIRSRSRSSRATSRRR